ncbi:MAG: integrase/recombinase XerC [Actinomycetota bacterium]|nr:integrase/recombinase XerC [Actinomycetota bacterium]
MLFARTGAAHPADLTEAAYVEWATTGNDGQRLANNSIRQRTATLRTFLRWCARNGELTAAHLDRIIPPDQPVSRTPRVYGKLQAPNPARWLDHGQAFGQLIDACRDDTPLAIRDELIIRLGLNGLRAEEIRSLTWKAVSTTPPELHWTGKGYRARTITIGAALADALDRWVVQVTGIVGHPPTPKMPIVCTTAGGFGALTLRPHLRVSDHAVWRVVTHRARLAGLGHVTPHDLRRSAAGILHHSTDATGAHHFDLLDIQKVLGHADPATTMRCYLDPLDTGARDRAASVLG